MAIYDQRVGSGAETALSQLQTTARAVPVTLYRDQFNVTLRLQASERTEVKHQVVLPAQPVNATPVLSRSARTRQPQSRKVVPGSRVQPRNSL